MDEREKWKAGNKKEGYLKIHMYSSKCKDQENTFDKSY
jgi:hypothetical protein